MQPSLKRCLTASALALTACVTVGKQKPPAPQTCSPEALALMKKLGMEPGQQGSMHLEASQPGGTHDYGVFRPGQITSRLETTVGSLPAGTLVDGVLWMDTGKVQAQYTQAHTPDGQNHAVCLVLGSSAPGGVYAEAGTTPGSLTLPKSVPFIVVEKFE
jgi:serine/threonine-protein kinase